MHTLSRSRRAILGLIVALTVVAVVAAVIQTRDGLVAERQPTPPSVPSPAGSSSSAAPTTTPQPDLQRADGGDPDATAGPTPTDVASPGGSDTHQDQVPAAEQPRLARRAAQFWNAFSTRDPDKRDKALAAVTVPYLAEQMMVDRTDRVPVLRPRRTAVVDGSFSSALAVTQMDSGQWWYVVFVYDPAEETWRAQEYEEATTTMARDAEALLRR